MALPRGDMDWSAVCDCGISCSCLDSLGHAHLRFEIMFNNYESTK